MPTKLWTSSVFLWNAWLKMGPRFFTVLLAVLLGLVVAFDFSALMIPAGFFVFARYRVVGIYSETESGEVIVKKRHPKTVLGESLTNNLMPST